MEYCKFSFLLYTSFWASITFNSSVLIKKNPQLIFQKLQSSQKNSVSTFKTSESLHAKNVEKRTVSKKRNIEVDDKTLKDNSKEIDYSCTKTNFNGDKFNLKIMSWNVAGYRANIKKGGLKYIENEDADIVCLQETKCTLSNLPPETNLKFPQYKFHLAPGSVPGYAGVALYTKEIPLKVAIGINHHEFDKEGRIITAEYKKFYLVSTYVPNAGQMLKYLNRRLEWNALLHKRLEELDAKKPVILVGDLNVAHEPIDLTNPKANTKSPGFTKEERDGFSTLLKSGFIDTFRHLYPDKTGAYTYWNYLRKSRSRNSGWRLDYFVLSKRLKHHVCDTVMRSHVLGSDHCPIVLYMNI